jgi:hypothetical protein
LVTQNGAYGACVVTFFSEFYMKASTSSGWYLHQLGGRLLTGRTEWDFPFSCFGNAYTYCAPKPHCTDI